VNKLTQYWYIKETITEFYVRRNKSIQPAFGVQYNSVICSQGHWLFQLTLQAHFRFLMGKQSRPTMVKVTGFSNKDFKVFEDLLPFAILGEKYSCIQNALWLYAIIILILMFK
jgi:hypothetical protein